MGVDEEDGQTRYRMLEMVREFGAERLAETQEAARVDAAMIHWAIGFADWYCDFVCLGIRFVWWERRA